MPNMMEHVDYLSREIGPRPAGTEEEQQAAIYIKDQFGKSIGLPVAIEEFEGATGNTMTKVICAGVAIVAALLGMIASVLAIPALIFCLVATGLLVADFLGKPVIARFFSKGISQNVVAKYQPETAAHTTRGRKRKIVVVTRYDSGKVRPELNPTFASFLGIATRASAIAVPFLLVWQLIRTIIGVNLVGGGAVFMNIVTLLAIVCAALPILLFAFARTGAYNNGANSSASGVAVMLDVAQRVMDSSMMVPQYLEDEDEPVIHGEEAAYAEGLIPEGAEVSYEAEQTDVGGQEDALPINVMSTQSFEPIVIESDVQEGDGADISMEAAPAVTVDEFVAHAPVSKAPAEEPLVPSAAETAEMAPIVVEDAPLDEDAAAAFAALDALAPAAPVEPVEAAAVATAADVTPAAAVASAVAAEAAVVAPVAAPAMPPAAPKPPMPPAPPAPSASPVAPVAEVAEVAAAAVVAAPAAPASQPVPVENSFSNYNSVPDWFSAAKRKAKKKDEGEPVVQRSRYANALEEALSKRNPEPVVEPVIDPMPALEPMTEMMTEPAPVVAEPEPMVETSAEELMVQPAAETSAMAPIVVEDAPLDEDAAAAFAALDALAPAAPVEPVASAAAAAMAPAVAPVTASAAPAAVPIAPAPVEPEPSVAAPVEEAAIAEFATQNMAPIVMPEVPQDFPAMPEFLQGNEAPAAPRERITVETPSLDDFSTQEIEPIQINRAPVVLPEVAASDLKPIDDMMQQRAPLADGAAKDSSSAAKSLLMLPSISLSMQPVSPEKQAARPSVNSLPSFSGILKKVDAAADPVQGSAGMTGSFAPVGEALIESVEKEEDLYIDDADDSAYQEDFTETGAYAGPGYVEMPKSRFGGFFDRFRRKKDPEPMPVASTQEWLDVDEDFDARSVGEARGNWESFQEASEWNADQQGDAADAYNAYEADASSAPYAEAYAAYKPENQYGQYPEQGYEEEFQPAESTKPQRDDFSPRNWEGGAFSGMKDRISGVAGGVVSGVSGAVGSVKDKVPFGGLSGKAEEVPASSRRSSRRSKSAAEGDRPARQRKAYSSEFANLDLGLPAMPSTYEEDVQAIEQFENPPIQTEMWFVALGSDFDGNAGMRAFIDANSPELKGAIIIELDSVGAGQLSYIDVEGSLKPIKASSRMKRYIRKAAQATGMSLPTVTLNWSDSASSYANSHGCQAMHLAGLDGNKQALLGQADDVVESIEESNLVAASDYVMELARLI